MAWRETDGPDSLPGGRVSNSDVTMSQEDDTKDFNYHSSAFPKFHLDPEDSNPSGIKAVTETVETLYVPEIQQLDAIKQLRTYANVIAGVLVLVTCGLVWRIVSIKAAFDGVYVPHFMRQSMTFTVIATTAVVFCTIGLVYASKHHLNKIESKYREAIEYNARLYSFSHSLSRAHELKDIYSAITKEFAKISGAVIGSLHVIGDDGKAYMSASSNVPEHMAKEAAVLDLGSTDAFISTHPVVVATKSGEPSWISTPANVIKKYANDRTEGILEETRVRSVMAMPLKLGKKVSGVLLIGFDFEDEFTDALRTFSLGAAALGAQAIERGRLYQEAQNAIRLRDDFLSIASHELKTPISSLHLQLQAAMHHLYKDFDKTNPQVPYRTLESAVRSTTKLANLIDELLNVARIASGNFTIEFENVDISALVHEILFRFSETIKQQEYAVTFNSSPGTFVKVDKMKADQVITNLISNAIKYGRGEPIHIGIERHKGFAEICVSDHGIGIAQEDHEKIFKRYTRVAKDPAVGGFGLGLWIVNKIVTQMNGSIHLESKLGEGSTFKVLFPMSPGGMHEASSGG